MRNFEVDRVLMNAHLITGIGLLILYLVGLPINYDMRIKQNNSYKVKQSYLAAHRASSEAIFDKTREILNEPRYWEGFENRTTYRQNGEVIEGAFRNIRDTGDLADSQRLTINHQGNATFEWGGGKTPAAAVYFGSVNESGQYIPGRPWLQTAIDELDLGKTFQTTFQKNV